MLDRYSANLNLTNTFKLLAQIGIVFFTNQFSFAGQSVTNSDDLVGLESVQIVGPLPMFGTENSEVKFEITSKKMKIVGGTFELFGIFGTDSRFSSTSKDVEITETIGTDLLAKTQLKIQIPKTMPPGTYHLKEIQYINCSSVKDCTEYSWEDEGFDFNTKIVSPDGYYKKYLGTDVDVLSFQISSHIQDNTPPSMKSISLGKTLPKIGYEFDVIVELNEDASGILQNLILTDQNGPFGWKASLKQSERSENFFKMKGIYPDINAIRIADLGSNLYALTFRIPDKYEPGNYFLDSLTFADKSNHLARYYSSSSNIPYAYYKSGSRFASTNSGIAALKFEVMAENGSLPSKGPELTSVQLKSFISETPQDFEIKYSIFVKDFDSLGNTPDSDPLPEKTTFSAQLHGVSGGGFNHDNIRKISNGEFEITFKVSQCDRYYRAGTFALTDIILFDTLNNRSEWINESHFYQKNGANWPKPHSSRYTHFFESDAWVVLPELSKDLFCPAIFL